MSDSGAPPPHDPNPYGEPNPYEQPNPYGQPAPPPYGQPQDPSQSYGQTYAQQPYGQPGYGAPAYDYSHWIKRVGSYLLDGLFLFLSAIPAYVLLFVALSPGTQHIETVTDANGVSRTTGDWNSAGTPLVVIGAVLFLVPLGFFIWNVCLRQGRTGYSLGNGILGMRLIGVGSGQPIGGGMSFLRQLCHIADSFCYIGYLWPLWDAKRQTFADKIMSTVVVNQPK